MAAAPPDELGLDSMMTASNMRRVTSFGSVDACFAAVTEASLNACLNWLWMSGSPLINKILKADDVGDMKVPGENGEEVRIIAQSQFDVNQEIREKTNLVAQAPETNWSSLAGRQIMFLRVRFDVLIETLLGPDDFYGVLIS
jgi:hypothetical protein